MFPHRSGGAPGKPRAVQREVQTIRRGHRANDMCRIPGGRQGCLPGGFRRSDGQRVGGAGGRGQLGLRLRQARLSGCLLPRELRQGLD